MLENDHFQLYKIYYAFSRRIIELLHPNTAADDSIKEHETLLLQSQRHGYVLFCSAIVMLIKPYENQANGLTISKSCTVSFLLICKEGPFQLSVNVL